MTDMTRVPISFDLTVLDTDQPLELAGFYARLLGWRIVRTDDDWVTVRGGPGVGLAFQLSPDHVPPTWPDESVRQQIHLDFDVDDLDEGEAWAVECGARPIPLEPMPEGFRPFADPSGHVFCLCLRS